MIERIEQAVVRPYAERQQMRATVSNVPRRKKGWTFYQRDESAIKKMKNAIVTRI